MQEINQSEEQLIYVTLIRPIRKELTLHVTLIRPIRKELTLHVVSGKTVGYFMSNRTLEERVPIFLDHVKKYNDKKKAEEIQDNLKQEQPSMFQAVKQYFGFDTAPAT